MPAGRRFQPSRRRTQRGINEQAGRFAESVNAGRGSIREYNNRGTRTGNLLRPGFGQYDYDIPNVTGGEGRTVGTQYESPLYRQQYDTQVGREGELAEYNALPKRGVEAQMRGMGIGEIAGGAGAAWEMAQKDPIKAGAFGFAPTPFGYGRRGGH
jgi:hypothetical protein